MVISEQRLTRALEYLAHSDQDCADLKANVARTEYLAKLKEAVLFKTAEGNIEERKAIAKSDESAVAAWTLHFNAVASYEKVRAKRELEALVIDVFRSLNANRRQGIL